MSKYLLLRDNKQTGPYTLEDVRTLGLKPYDLVWVDGKSAAWRYPGEVDELKSFAPPLVEQPFDRFYKKPIEKKSEQRYEEQLFGEDVHQKVEPVHQKPRITSIEANQQSPRENKEPKRPKYVSVSLPSGSVENTAQKKSSETTLVSGVPKIEEPHTFPVITAQPARNTVPVVPSLTESRPVYVAQEENPKKNTVQNPALLFPDRTINTKIENDDKPIRSKITSKKEVMTGVLQGFAIAAGLVSLVAVGILIGVNIGNSKTIELPASNEPDKSQLTAMSVPAAVHTDTTITTHAVAMDTALKSPVTEYNQVPKPVKRKSFEKQNVPVIQVAKDDPIIPELQATVVKPDIDKEAVRRDIVKKISVETNDYKVGMFGGIDDVKVTVHNGSEYPVDLVIVDVSYIQSNKKYYKTESLRFNNIAANSSLTLEAPKTNKGIKVLTALSDIKTAYGGL